MDATAVRGEGFNPPEVLDLIARAQKGDNAAFDEIIGRYQRYVFNLIYQHLGSTDELEDIAQEVFLRVFKFIRKFRGDSSLESWIYKIILNYCRTQARRKRFLSRFVVSTHPPPPQEEKSFDIVADYPDPTKDPALAVEDQRTVESILSALEALPQIYRDILIMREINELSYDEIAKILGISVGTVKSRIARARELIRQRVIL